MPTLSLDFEVFCECGAGLCNQSTEGSNGHSQYITVEPCSICLAKESEESYDKGQTEGYEEGKSEGYKEGYDDGCAES